MELDFYKMRLESIKEAAQRSRWVFALATIASIANIAVIWNNYLSAVRPLMLVCDWAKEPAIRDLQADLARAWVDSIFVTVPLLGIKISAADASVVGGFALTVIAVWLFYNFRRENHLIGITLYAAKEESPETKAFVYHGVCGTQVFATVTDNDEPITNVEDKPDVLSKQVLAVRGVFSTLVYLPAVAIWLSILFDLLTMDLPFIGRIKSIFRAGHPLILFKWYYVLYLLLGIIFGVCSTFLLWRASQFQKGTVTLLRAIDNWGRTTPTPPCEATVQQLMTMVVTA